MRILLALFFLVVGTSAADAQEREQSPPRRSVVNNILSSQALPKITIKVADEFEFVGSFPFEIIAASEEYPEEHRGKPVAAGERFVFAASDNNQVVDKLFVVQFEGFLPNNDFAYNYDFSTAEAIGENKYRHNLWFYDSAKLARETPKNEGAKTRRFLQDKGYTLEDDFMMSRFVGLASTDRKNEIIIYYLEMLRRSTGHTLDHFEHSLPPAEVKVIERAFLQRSQASFEVIEG